jgi:hypothetical protein
MFYSQWLRWQFRLPEPVSLPLCRLPFNSMAGSIAMCEKVVLSSFVPVSETYHKNLHGLAFNFRRFSSFASSSVGSRQGNGWILGQEHLLLRLNPERHKFLRR